MESYKTSAYVSQMSPCARDGLSTVVESLFNEANKIDVKSLQSTTHETYESVRSAHLKAAALATICDDPRLSHLLQNWSSLQAIYVPQVKRKLFKSKTDFNDSVKEWKPEADKAVELEKEREAKWAAIQKLRAPPSMQELQEYQALSSKAEEAKGFKLEYEGALKALQGLNKAVEDLDRVTSLEGVESIHYHIPSAETILDQLKKGEYTGIPFEPFQMLKSGLVSVVEQESSTEDESQEEQAIPSSPVNLQDKPKELSDLLKLKETIDKLAAGRKVDSSYLRKLIPGQDFTYCAKGIRCYVRAAAQVFGMTVGDDGREFTKIARPALSEQEFLGQILDHLKPSESGRVNEFYINRALQRLRENCKGYEGFTVEDVFTRVREDDKFPISRKGVAVNLGKFSERYGVEYNEQDDPRVFTFTEVIPTDKQTGLVETIVKTFGYQQFTPEEACRAVFEKKLGIVSPRLIVEVLKRKQTDFGIEQIREEPRVYRRRERPVSAQADLKAAAVDADESAAF